MKKLKPYPAWVCIDCAKNALTQDALKKLEGSLSTFHYGICEICGEMKAVTEPRDFWWPFFSGYKSPR